MRVFNIKHRKWSLRGVLVTAAVLVLGAGVFTFGNIAQTNAVEDKTSPLAPTATFKTEIDKNDPSKVIITGTGWTCKDTGGGAGSTIYVYDSDDYYRDPKGPRLADGWKNDNPALNLAVKNDGTFGPIVVDTAKVINQDIVVWAGMCGGGVAIQRIDPVNEDNDTTKPSAEADVPSALTNQPVTVTLTADETIQTPAGWTEIPGSNGTQFTKVYTENTNPTDTVEIVDLAGNKGNDVIVDVKTINLSIPTIELVSPADGATLETRKPEIKIIARDDTNVASVWIYVFAGDTCYPSNPTKQFTRTSKETGVSGAEYSFVKDDGFAKELPDGLYCMSYWAFDESGNKSAIGESHFTVSIDTEAPIISEFQLSPATPTNSDVIVTVIAHDNKTADADLEYSFDGGTTWSKNNTTIVGENSTVNVLVRDEKNNISEAGTKAVENIDKTVPYLSLTRNAVGSDPYSKIDLQFKDSGKNLKEIVINGRTFRTMTEAKKSGSEDVNWVNASGYYKEGENIIVVRDWAGNEFTYKLNIDKSAAIVDVKFENTGTTYVNDNKEVCVVVTVNEKLANAPTVKLGSIAATVTDNGDNTYRACITTNDTIKEGAISVEVSDIKNVAGLTTTDVTATSDGSATILDRTPPKIDIRKSTGGNSDGTYQTVTNVYVSDARSPLTVWVDGVEQKHSDPKAADIGYTTGRWKDGKHTIKACDAAGNCIEETYDIDQTAPEVRLERITECWTNGNGVMFYIYSSEPLQKPGTWAMKDTEGKVWYKNIPSNQNFTQEVKDLVGNSAIVSGSVSCIDKTAPTINNLAVSPEGQTTEATITVDAIDGKGTTQWDRSYDGIGLADEAYSINGVNWQASNEFKVTENGEYTIYVRDALGNQSSKTVTIDNIKEEDPIPPTVPESTAVATIVDNGDGTFTITGISGWTCPDRLTTGAIRFYVRDNDNNFADLDNNRSVYPIGNISINHTVEGTFPATQFNESDILGKYIAIISSDDCHPTYYAGPITNAITPTEPTDPCEIDPTSAGCNNNGDDSDNSGGGTTGGGTDNGSGNDNSGNNGGGSLTPVIRLVPAPRQIARVNYAVDATTDDEVVVAEEETEPTPTTSNYNYNYNDYDQGEVLGVTDAKEWAVMNLILAICTVLGGIIVLAIRKNKGAFKVAGAVAAVVAVVAFFLTEDWTLPMVWVDIWTILMAVIAIVQVVVMALAHNKSDDREDA
jgi:hypothetical protein